MNRYTFSWFSTLRPTREAVSKVPVAGRRGHSEARCSAIIVCCSDTVGVGRFLTQPLPGPSLPGLRQLLSCCRDQGWLGLCGACCRVNWASGVLLGAPPIASPESPLLAGWPGAWCFSSEAGQRGEVHPEIRQPQALRSTALALWLMLEDLSLWWQPCCHHGLAWSMRQDGLNSLTILGVNLVLGFDLQSLRDPTPALIAWEEKGFLSRSCLWMINQTVAYIIKA